MTRTASISLRVQPEMKDELEKLARQEGRTLAAYVERVLMLHRQPPAWVLGEAQPLHSKKSGPSVVFRVADGWPLAGISAKRAEQLGEQLISTAKIARRLPPAE